jgi:hypothetical protein
LAAAHFSFGGFQLSKTVMGDGAASSGEMFIRKRWPSRETAYCWFERGGVGSSVGKIKALSEVHVAEQNHSGKIFGSHSFPTFSSCQLRMLQFRIGGGFQFSRPRSASLVYRQQITPPFPACIEDSSGKSSTKTKSMRIRPASPQCKRQKHSVLPNSLVSLRFWNLLGIYP